MIKTSKSCSVPTGYKFYDYIWIPRDSGSSTDPRLFKPTGSLIRLKQYSNLDLISYEFDFICSQAYPSNFNVPLLGGRSASGVTNSLACYISGQYKVMAHYHGIEKFTNLTYSLNNKTRVKYQNTSTSPSQLIVNGNSEDLVWTNTVSISNTGPHLFGNPTPNDLSSMSKSIPVTVKTKISKIKVYDLSGNLINNYVPCVRKSDNVIGMYDTVENVFYTAYQITYSTIGSGNCSYEVGDYDIKKITTKVNGVMKDISYIKTKVNNTMETVFDKVPSAYTRYDYIWTPINSGSSSEPRIWRSYQALIMLKEYANLDLVSYEFDFKSEQVYPTDYNLCLLGGRSVNGETNGVGFYITGQYKTFNMCHGSNHYTNLTYTLGVKSHIKYKNTSVSPSELTVDGSSENLTWSNVVSIPNTKLVLFINYVKNDTGNPIQTVRVKIGTVKVYDLSGNLINNYVPCVRKSDNVIGMYDTVENVFYTTSNTTYATIGNRNCIYEVGNW